MNQISVLDPFFHLNSDGELVRDKNPKGGWLAKAKDARLARGFILKATCRRRFLGWRTTILELSEREVSDAIGPHAIRIAREEDADVMYAKPVPIPLNQKNLQSLDGFVGNDDGVLVRNLQGGDFSKSASDVSLTRATILLASLPKADNSINLVTVPLEEAELASLKVAADKEREWKRQVEEKARTTVKDAPLKEAETKVEEQQTVRKPAGLFACCFPAKSSKSGKKNARSGRAASHSKPVNPQAVNHSGDKVSGGKQPEGHNGFAKVERPPVEIGTPSVPPLHRDAVDRTVRQIAQAAASESWDPAWRRIGASDGLTWLMKDSSKTLMVRGTIRAPPRTVFEYIWSDDTENLLGIEPRISEARMVESDLDGTGHSKTQLRTTSPEWGFATGLTEEDEESKGVTCLRHYHVHPDGTIFIVELCGQDTGGLVIAPVQGAELSSHVAWVESPSFLRKLATNKLEPWASSRVGAILAKLLGDRLQNVNKYGLIRAPYSDFDSALSRGQVVNHNGNPGALPGAFKSTGNTLAKDKMREFDELSKFYRQSPEQKQFIMNQIESAAETVRAAIPEERKRFRTQFEEFHNLLKSYMASPRSSTAKTGAQYLFDCIMVWILSALPTDESWVEDLTEQIAMRNIEAQTTYGRRLDNESDPQINNRISKIMSRDRERAPSL